jgi:hypothetical protein
MYQQEVRIVGEGGAVRDIEVGKGSRRLVVIDYVTIVHCIFVFYVYLYVEGHTTGSCTREKTGDGRECGVV